MTQSKDMKMTREFKAGDRVRLSDKGQERFTDTKANPHDAVGVVVVCNVDFGWDYDTKVDWPNGENYYNHADLTHTEPVPIGYTGKLRDMDLQEGDVVGWHDEDENNARWTVMGNGDLMGRQTTLCPSYLGEGGNSDCDKFVLLSRAQATPPDQWSDWLLSRKDGTMSQRYAEVQTVPLDGTDQVAYRGRGVAPEKASHLVSVGHKQYYVTTIDGEPDWSNVEDADAAHERVADKYGMSDGSDPYLFF